MMKIKTNKNNFNLHLATAFIKACDKRKKLLKKIILTQKKGKVNRV